MSPPSRLHRQSTHLGRGTVPAQLAPSPEPRIHPFKVLCGPGAEPSGPSLYFLHLDGSYGRVAVVGLDVHGDLHRFDRHRSVTFSMEKHVGDILD